MDRDRFYVTTPIYYPNDKLHIGHTYTTVAADSLARYHRLRGRDTWFLTGTDEHGLNLQRAAAQAGKEPLEYIDPIVEWIQNLWARLHISYDDFIRTTEERHRTRVQAIFQRLYEQDDIYKGTYRGLYCVRCEAYYGEDDLAEGGLCPIHERPVEWLEEESYFFRLSKYAEPLLRHIQANPDFVQPESRRNEVIGFIRQGLEDLSVSRTSFRWGIPVPFDPNHVIYVWIDALANYATALGYPDAEHYRRFWPADLHLIGKDILRFHAIIWPAVLMALGEPLPRCVYGHGWLLIDGGKMGKSRAGSQVIDPLALIDRYGVDAVRYFLVREVPFGADGNYSEEALVRRLNSDLANDLGNLVWRTTAMIERFCGGRVPDPQAAPPTELPDVAAGVRGRVEQHMERFELNLAVAAVWDLIGRANKTIDEAAPWDLHRRGEAGRLGRVLYDVAEAARYAAVLLAPFLVHTPERIYGQLGFAEDLRATGWDAGLTWGRLPVGARVERGEPLFPRIDVEALFGSGDGPGDGPEDGEGHGEGDAKERAARTTGRQGGKPEARHGAEAGAGAAAAPEIDIDEFGRLDLRVVHILEAAHVEGTDRLLRLKVSLGTGGERQVVAGIAGHYRPEDLVGRQAVLVANLKPARIRGVDSQGMLLAASDGQRVVLLSPEQPVTPGSRVR
ncbi:MAG TPA: methionine--tRNA ligase [Bacillota bacterium]